MGEENLGEYNFLSDGEGVDLLFVKIEMHLLNIFALDAVRCMGRSDAARHE